MPFSAAEDERGARVIGADRATWLRLGIAVALGLAAIGGPAVAGTAASYTDTEPVTLTVSTADDFEPTDPPALDVPFAPTATSTEPSVAQDRRATDD